MTRPRVFGSDMPFLGWLRGQRDLDASRMGITVNDVDVFVHKFKVHTDKFGTREIQLMFDLEIKSHDGAPDANQRQSLFFRHQRIRTQDKNRGGEGCFKPVATTDFLDGKEKLFIHYGCYLLQLSGNTPDNSSTMRWCRFDKRGVYHPTVLSMEMLKSILRFETHPFTIRPLEFRRRHNTQEIVECTNDDLPLFHSTGVAPQLKVFKRKS